MDIQSKLFETVLEIDEASTHMGRNYINVFVDMLLHEIVFVTPGKDASTIAEFCTELKLYNGKPQNIRNVSMDMSPAFISGAKKFLPHAEISFDKFHVIKQLNEAIGSVRRAETHENPCLKGSKYLWLKNPGNLTARQRSKLKTLSRENRRLSKAYQMKLTLQNIYRLSTSLEAADSAVRKWLS